MSWEREVEENGQWVPYDPNAEQDGNLPPSSGGNVPPPSGFPGLAPDATHDPYDPYYDYNNGSPVDAPLKAGHGWEWNDKWTQVAGRGPGYQPAPAGPTPTPSNPRGNGSVPAVGGGGGGSYSAPSASLPSGITDLFNRVPERTPIQSAYQDALLKYMGKAQQTPSLDDPTLAPQVEVFRASNQRATERNRRSAAERAAATGQSESGYLDNLIAQGVQQQGFNESSFNANLLGGEMNKRREELKAALQLAAATGDAEAARELQTRLAQVSAMMQQQGLNLQGQLGFGDLDLRRTLGLEQLNQNALQLIMGAL